MLDAPGELAQDRAEVPAAVRRAGVGRRVPQVAVRVAQPHEPELVEVPRDGRLRGREPEPVEPRGDLLLAGERLHPHQVEQCLLSLSLHVMTSLSESENASPRGRTVRSLLSA